MFYTIYKVTNEINGKIYIGKHQTKDLDDGYMGSGKHLKRSIEKYGIENFKKEILFVFDNEYDMNIKEAELVTDEFVKEDTNYNLCPGGNGGFGYINSVGLNVDIEKQRKHNPNIIKDAALKGGLAKKKLMLDKNYNSKVSKNVSKGLIKYFTTNPGNFSGKTHTEETKQKMRNSAKGKQIGDKNSQFGTMWITNGQENKKIKKEIDIIPEGWYKGRVNKL